MSEHKRNKNNRSGNQLLKTGMVWTILLAALVAVFVLSIAIGSSGYPLSEVLRGLWDTEAGKIRIIVFNLRLPRAVLAIMVGACLSAAGAILQAVMRNPLADPGTIGVSAGAGAAAITILLSEFDLFCSVVCIWRSCTCMCINISACMEGWCGSGANHFVRCRCQFCLRRL